MLTFGGTAFVVDIGIKEGDELKNKTTSMFRIYRGFVK